MAKWFSYRPRVSETLLGRRWSGQNRDLRFVGKMMMMMMKTIFYTLRGEGWGGGGVTSQQWHSVLPCEKIKYLSLGWL